MTDDKSPTRFFQSKAVPPSLRNCLHRVLCFHSTFAHIAGRANYAADFFVPSGNDQSLEFEFKLTDEIVVREIGIERKAKQPDLSMSHFTSFDELLPEESLGQHLETLLKDLGVYDAYLQQHKTIPCEDESSVVGFVQLSQKSPSVSIVQESDSMDSFLTSSEFGEINLVQKQAKKILIFKTFLRWKVTSSVPYLQYAIANMRKYAKHFNRSVVKDGVLHRQFFDAVGAV